ncbi:hypothetical protein QTO34_007836 [Cnephaeus nilssonii]|uniref:Uncharacterized protein n=1 Tax=Cnephaeus nilssonii TaxID=3371016 RepID=A0AA40HJY9_CNENI|nr:hypothetical protein QTO34_007836 [Eptesicus nilssonii]
MLRAPLASPYRWLSVRQEARVEGSPESRRKAEWSPSLSCHANGLLGPQHSHSPIVFLWEDTDIVGGWSGEDSGPGRELGTESSVPTWLANSARCDLNTDLNACGSGERTFRQDEHCFRSPLERASKCRRRSPRRLGASRKGTECRCSSPPFLFKEMFLNDAPPLPALFLITHCRPSKVGGPKPAGGDFGDVLNSTASATATEPLPEQTQAGPWDSFSPVPPLLDMEKHKQQTKPNPESNWRRRAAHPEPSQAQAAGRHLQQDEAHGMPGRAEFLGEERFPR